MALHSEQQPLWNHTKSVSIADGCLRLARYVEQNDIHSPQLTVEESLHFSATLRLHDVDAATSQEFVGQVRP